MFTHHPAAEPPKVALEYLAKSRYGFCLLDLGITDDDLALFDQLHIDTNRDCNLIGDPLQSGDEVVRFFREIGTNDEALVQKLARRINEMVRSILDSSDKKMGWICLRCFVPSPAFDLAQWHFDGGYFCPINPKGLIYKFIVALKGPSTLFYLVPREDQELRKILGRNSWNPSLTRPLCDPEKVFSPERGQGAVFLAANRTYGAFHTEPPIHEPRLLFSLAPCYEGELAEMRARVQDYFLSRNRSKM